MLSTGLDLAAVFPKYINLRRGAYVIALFSIAPNLWKQLTSGSTFLSILSAYAIFIGPFIGLICVHFYITQQRVFHFPDLYTRTLQSVYFYVYGVNWRSFVAWMCACIPNMPGFGALDPWSGECWSCWDAYLQLVVLAGVLSL